MACCYVLMAEYFIVYGVEIFIHQKKNEQEMMKTPAETSPTKVTRLSLVRLSLKYT